jgi:hypothetical protein
LAGSQQRAGQNQIEFQSKLAYSIGRLHYASAAFERQRAISIFEHAALTQIRSYSMTHQVEFDHYFFPLKNSRQ